MKASARKKALAARDALTFEEKVRKSALICDQLLAYCKENLGSLQGKTIAVYAAMRSEVSLDAFIKAAYQSEAHLCFPCMQQEPSQMEFHTVSAKQYQKGNAPFIQDPLFRIGSEKELPEDFPLADPTKIDAIIVPLVAFDNKNNRLGYGGGNYDTFLPNLNPNTLIIGIAFSGQQVTTVPTEPHDIPLPHIIFA